MLWCLGASNKKALAIVGTQQMGGAIAMGTGITFIEINYDSNWVNNALLGIQGFSWLFEWGMYLFLLLTIGMLFWVFFDSITKRKDRQALVPRILCMIGCFLVIPAFIFRFTGNADGVSTLVRLGAEGGIYYPGAINWNVNWLVSGFGPIIAVLALLGVVISTVGIVIYASSVQRAKPSTEFVQAFNSQMSSLERKVDDVSRASAQAASAAAASQSFGPQVSSMSGMPSSPAPSRNSATIIDRKPSAATIIDIPKSGSKLTVRTGNGRGNTYDLPAGEVVIGREPGCFITLDDGKVSGKHLRLIHGDDTWYVLDLGSTNGTFVNGQKAYGQLELQNGDEIKIGDTIMVFSRA